MSFALDPRLEADTLPVGDLELCRVRLMNDARYPWLILVPRRAGLVEIVDLDREGWHVLMDEIALASEVLRGEPGVGKVNVGALGNIVRQLHVHVVGRTVGDFAWPGPVWGAGTARRYEGEAAETFIARLRERMAAASIGRRRSSALRGKDCY